MTLAKPFEVQCRNFDITIGNPPISEFCATAEDTQAVLGIE